MLLTKLGFEVLLFLIVVRALFSVRTISKSVVYISSYFGVRTHEVLKPDILLLSAYFENTTWHNEAKTFYLHESLRSITACAARALRIDYQFKRVESSHNSWPYPHYVKIHMLNSHLEYETQSHYKWFLWLDTDVRVINLEYPIQRLIHYAEQQDTHLIVNNQKSYSTVLNNVFLIRNSAWGRHFLKIWKYYANGGPSCGSYDQCPFSFSMLRTISDYKNDSSSRNEIDKTVWNSNTVLAKLYLKEKLEFYASQNKGYPNNASGILAVGPILMVPAWKHRLLEPNSISPALSKEPTCDMELINVISEPWPFSLHAKYSKLFCPDGKRFSKNAREKFIEKFETQLTRKCNALELNAFKKRKEVECWATIPV